MPAPLRNFGGSRLVEWQQALALRLGCEAIVCIVEADGTEVRDLQRAAEQAGARFTAVRDAHKLLGMVTATDEIFVLAPGLVPDEAMLGAALQNQAIAAFPAADALPLGYERIDADHAWAGAMLVRADLVERLAGLPEGIDPVSTLLRIGLQAGTPRVDLPATLLEAGDWQLAPSQEALDARTIRLIQGRAAPAPYTAPGVAVAERIGARLARDLLGGRAARLPSPAALAFGSGALAAAILDWPTLSLALLFMMTVAASIGAVVDRVADLPLTPARDWLARAARYLVDPLLLVSLALAAPEVDGWQRIYLPLAMILALHLGRQLSEERWRASFADRVLLTLVFVPAAAFDFTQALAAGVTLLALVSLFKVAGRSD